MTDHSQSPLTEQAEALEAIEATMCRLIGELQLGANPHVMKLMASVGLGQAELTQLGVGSDQSEWSH